MFPGVAASINWRIFGPNQTGPLPRPFFGIPPKELYVSLCGRVYKLAQVFRIPPPPSGTVPFFYVAACMIWRIFGPNRTGPPPSPALASRLVVRGSGAVTRRLVSANLALVRRASSATRLVLPHDIAVPVRLFASPATLLVALVGVAVPRRLSSAALHVVRTLAAAGKVPSCAPAPAPWRPGLVESGGVMAACVHAPPSAAVLVGPVGLAATRRLGPATLTVRIPVCLYVERHVADKDLQDSEMSVWGPGELRPAESSKDLQDYVRVCSRRLKGATASTPQQVRAWRRAHKIYARPRQAKRPHMAGPSRGFGWHVRRQTCPPPKRMRAGLQLQPADEWAFAPRPTRWGAQPQDS